MIPQDVLYGMLAALDSSACRQSVPIADLHVEEKDILAFKSFLSEQEKKIPKNKKRRVPASFGEYTLPDTRAVLNLYGRIADSLYRRPRTELGHAFLEYSTIMSTTTKQRMITFVFQDGKKLVVFNFDNAPNYLYMPWVAQYDRSAFVSTSIRFGEQLDKLTKGLFFSDVTRDKRYAIFRVVDYIYRKRKDAFSGFPAQDIIR